MWRFSWRALTAISAVNRFFMRRFTASGRVLLVALAAGAVFGIDTERSTTYQAFTLLAAVLALGWLGTLRFRAEVRVRRDLPRTATAGEPFLYRIHLANEGRHALTSIVVNDNLADPRPTFGDFVAAGPPPDARSRLARLSGYRRWRWLVAMRANAAAPSQTVKRIPASGSVELAFELLPRRRGQVRFDSVTLSRSDPFGIVNAVRDVTHGDRVVVLPRRYRLPSFELPGTRRYQHGGVALAASVGDSEEFLGLREYRPGDPVQRLHWKSFARTGQPIVKEMQDEFYERHALVLDTFGDVTDAQAFEEAVSIAASFVRTIETHDCLLDLMFVGDRPHRVTGGRAIASPTRLLEVLAVVQLAHGGRFDDLARAVLARREDLSGVILVLLGWDDARATLVRRLRGMGVAVLAFAVVRAGAVVADAPASLKVLEVGRVEEAMARLGNVFA